MTPLILRKSDWIDDWYVIEHDDGLSISDAGVEGTADEMRSIAQAIVSRASFSAKRCAVQYLPGSDSFEFWSPRNSQDTGDATAESADELAAAIIRTLEESETSTRHEETIAEATRRGFVAPSEDELSHTDEPRCPHCGYVDTEAWNSGLLDGEQDIARCGSCEGVFIVTAHVSYSTQVKVESEPTQWHRPHPDIEEPMTDHLTASERHLLVRLAEGLEEEGFHCLAGVFRKEYEKGQSFPLKSSAGNPPRVHFGASGDVMTAGPPGARIRCELERDDASRVTIRSVTGEHIAAVTVHAEGRDVTHETIAIASALYWSWWRARDMHGEAPIEDSIP